jgi:DNA-binding transcriptional regulator LsrR (DeoR family)
LPADVSAGSLAQAGAVGDIIGRFLDADGNPVEHAINRRVLAPALADLARIPTVIVASGGVNKTRIIAAVLRAKLASVLVCDSETAERAIERVVGTPRKSSIVRVARDATRRAGS